MYFVFDLDETLCSLRNVSPFLRLLHSEPLRHTGAYQRFVKGILAAETAPDPLGILRPGILPVMHELAARVQAGTLHPITIYSNNPSLEHLHFVRDLIHMDTGPVIGTALHWNHPIRAHDRLHPSFTKTWRTLKRAIGAPVTPAQVTFIDDQLHVDLQKHLKDQYIHIPSYRYGPAFEQILPIFLSVMDPADHAALYLELQENFAAVDSPQSLEETLKVYWVWSGGLIVDCTVRDSGKIWEAVLRHAAAAPFKPSRPSRE
jgi:hypothetical protein